MACVRFRRGGFGVDYRDELGRRRFVPCDSEEKARELLERITAELRPARVPGSSTLTVSAYAELFFAELRARAKPKTLARYRTAYRRHLELELGERLLEDVSRFELKRHLVRKHAAGVGLSMVVKVLSMLFTNAYEDGLIPKHPARGLKKLFRIDELAGEPKAFTAAELGRFLDASALEPTYDGLFRTMAFSGLRCGEARALFVKDVELDRGKLDVQRTFSEDKLSSSTKSGRSRWVEIPGVLVVELARRCRLRLGSEWLFPRVDGSFLREYSVRRAFKRALTRAGLSSSFTPHGLRHTYASLLIQQGARAEYVQRQLGHHSIKLTVDVYGRWLELSGYPALDRLVSSAERPRRGAREGVDAIMEPELEDEDTRPREVLPFKPRRAFVSPACTRTSSSPTDDEDGA